MGYGAGQGFAQGVQSMAGMILPAMQQRRAEKLYRDRLALGMGWDAGRSVPKMGANLQTDGSGQPYQSTRAEESPGFLGKMFGSRSEPTSGEALASGKMADPLNPLPARTFRDPINPSPAVRPLPAYGPQGPTSRPPNIVGPDVTTPPSKRVAPNFGHEPMYTHPWMPS